MAFATRVSRAGVELYFYARISGLPQVWTSEPQPWGAATTTILGETYDVVDGLMPDGLDTVLEEGIEPWAGIDQPSSLTLRLVADDTWLDYLSPNLYRGEVGVLADDCLRTDATLDIEDTTGFSAAGTVFVGLETLTYSGKTATTLTGCSRGLWGSTAWPHRAVWDGVDETGYLGPFVADHPLTMSGRFLELWVGTKPAGAAPCSAEDRRVFIGRVESAKLTQDLAAVEVQAISLLQAVDDEAAKRTPRARLIDLYGVVPVDDWSRNASYRLLRTAAPGGATFGNPSSTRFCSISGGSLLSYADLCSALVAVCPYIDSARIEEVSLDGGVGLRLVAIATGQSLITSGYRYSLIPLVTPDSVWAELGYEQGIFADVALSSSGVWTYYFEPTRPRPVLRIPKGATRTAWYEQIGSLGFAAQTWETAGGDTGRTFVRLGEEVYSIALTGETVDGADYTGLLLRQRGQFGSSYSEDAEYIEHSFDGDYPEIVQGPCFDLVEWPRVIAYLLCAGARTGGGYAAGMWAQVCGELPQEYLDTDAFDAASAGASRISLAVFEPSSIRDLIEPILVTYQHQIIVSDGQLTLIPVPLGLVSEPPVAELTHDDIYTAGGVSWDVPTDLVVSSVKATNLGYDYGAEKGLSSRTLVQGTALATWPASLPLSVDMRAQPSLFLGREAVARLADEIWPRWGAPFLVLKLSVGSEWGWLLEVGDAVSVSHTLIPDLITATRGVSSMAGWVYRVAKTWRDGETRGVITILVPAIDGTRITGWAPCARSTAVAGDTVSTEANYYSETGDTEDRLRFEVGDVCRIYNPGDESTAVILTIIARPAGGLQFNAAVGLSHPVEVEYHKWSSVVAGQQDVCFLANTGTPPYLGVNDEPYHYG